MAQTEITPRKPAEIALVDGAQRERFAQHFPKVFAYVLSWTQDEARSRDIVIEAFARVFGRGMPRDEEDFAVALYGITRDLSSGARQTGRHKDNDLDGREREVLALLFDAQLTRGQVSSLLKMPEETVVSTLVNGLRKLKRTATRGGRPVFQQQT